MGYGFNKQIIGHKNLLYYNQMLLKIPFFILKFFPRSSK